MAFKKGKVLHRDLSENNLMFKHKEGEAKGIVNDWDMASILNDAGEVPNSTAKHRTGTVPFMARDLLVPVPPAHLYRHDLESFMYILVWAAIHYDLKTKTRSEEIHPELRLWGDKKFKLALNAKETFVLTRGSKQTIFNFVREEFKGLLEDWIKPVVRLFREADWKATRCEEDGLEYDDVTGGGFLTFKEFMKTIGATPRSSDVA
jgi:hypothetical protein